MSKKNLQKVLGIILSTVMVAGLAACGSDATQGTTASSETQKESEVVSTTPTEPSEQEPEVAEITYPLDTDVKLKIWSNGSLKYQSIYESTDESPFHVGLAENTGVELEWEFPQDGTNTTQAFNLMIADGTLPYHILYYYPYPNEGEDLINDGLVWDLTEYLPIYAPDYWEYLQSDDAVRRAVTSTSGKYYKFCSSCESDYVNTYMGLAVRKDWLDECGLEIPETLEGWENVIRVFKDKYGATFSSPKLGFGMSSGTGAHADKSAAWYTDDNEQVVFANTEDEYKAFLEVMNKWYDEGLMDPDILTNDNSAIRNKCVNNEVGVMYIGSGTFRNILADAEAAGNGAEWIGVPHPVTEPGASVTWHQTKRQNCSNNGAMISKMCTEEEMIVALKFLNYGYTEEGKMYWNFGNEGESYYLDENGQPQWSELVTEDPAGWNTAYKYYIGTHSNGPSIQLDALIATLNQGVAGEAITQWISNSVAKEHYMPPVGLTEEESLEYTDTWAAIQTYTNECISAFIIGDKSFDEWDDYVKTLDSMGLEKCRKIQQAGYDRWLAK